MTEPRTIAALATAPQPAGIAVIRVSGPDTRRAISSLFRGKKNPAEYPREVIFGHLIDHKSSGVIDTALCFFMPGPASFTGEDVGEFQFHGSPLLVHKMLRSLYSFGLAPAEPGEFTKRAFLNGKVDLLQAEAIADVINATSEQALKIAGEQLRGKLSSVVAEIGEPLRDVLAEVEANIDFPEEDIAPDTISKIASSTREQLAKIDNLLATYAYGHVMREGFRILLCGRPNAGKSSLLNQFLGVDRAIVTEVSGTTRDIIEEHAVLGGFRFCFCDSAGIRETSDIVEKIGVELAIDRLSWADLVLVVVDGSAETSTELNELLEFIKQRAAKMWLVVNKIDLNQSAIGTLFCDSDVCDRNFYISARNGNGLDGLIQALCEEVSNQPVLAGETGVVITSERHRKCLELAIARVNRFLEGVDNKAPLEILAEDLRQTLLALEELVGKTTPEDILGRIFAKFCIGK